MPKETVRKCAVDLERTITYSKLVNATERVTTTKMADIDDFMLYEGIEAIKPIILSKLLQTPVKMLEFLDCNNRSTVFPNLFINFIIFLTITVAFGEMLFSKHQNFPEVNNEPRMPKQFEYYINRVVK